VAEIRAFIAVVLLQALCGCGSKGFERNEKGMAVAPLEVQSLYFDFVSYDYGVSHYFYLVSSNFNTIDKMAAVMRAENPDWKVETTTNAVHLTKGQRDIEIRIVLMDDGKWAKALSMSLQGSEVKSRDAIIQSFMEVSRPPRELVDPKKGQGF
jgi:hypothetical protein